MVQVAVAPTEARLPLEATPFVNTLVGGGGGVVPVSYSTRSVAKPHLVTELSVVNFMLKVVPVTQLDQTPLA
jgi:hypothetical protein